MAEDMENQTANAEGNEGEGAGTESQGSSAKGTPREIKQAFQEGSPEEVKASTKQLVQKGVAAMSGALKGVADSAEKEDVAGATRKAVRQMGETTKAIAQEGAKQLESVKGEVKSTGAADAEAMGVSSATDIEGTSFGSTGSAGSTASTGAMSGSGSETPSLDVESPSSGSSLGKPPEKRRDEI